jgi:tetratricopeptide (TPR) repeat protein
MADRWVAALLAAAAAALLLYGADRAGYLRLPWPPAEAGQQSAVLRATRTLDLESGEQGTPKADLHWGMAARDQPYLGVRNGALIAQAGGARWEDLDPAALARLSYATNRFSAWGPDAPVRRGAQFAVRSIEGNFAKLRIARVSDDHELKLEWVLYSRRAEEQPVPEGPALAWLPARDEALAAYRAQRYQEALDACGRAVAIAAQAGDAQHALALLTCGGLMNLHRRASQQMEEWLKQAVAIATRLDQAAIVGALGPREAMLKERCLHMLGVYYRDQRRAREAAENFALAVDAVRALPPPETGEQRLALRSDLYDLGVTLALLGYHGIAIKALTESREYYLKTEPKHPALHSIDEQLRRLN